MLKRQRPERQGLGLGKQTRRYPRRKVLGGRLVVPNALYRTARPRGASTIVLRYCSGFLEASTLLVMLAAVKPRTMATRQIRSSRAMDRVEGDKSMECLMFNVEKAMTCLTATSERSIFTKNSGGPGVIWPIGPLLT